MRRLATALLAIALLFVAGPAVAAPGDVEYSLDEGATWSTTPPASLFDASFRYVPGDTVTAVLLVRSLRADPTVVAAVIDNASVPDADYASALTVSADDGTGAGLAPVLLADAPDCAPLVPPRVLQTGEILRIELSIAISPDLVAQESQNEVASFDVELGMTDVGVPTLPNGCPIDPTVIPGLPGGGTGGPVAVAGVDLVPATILATLAFVSGGVLLAIARRTRTESA